MNANIRCLIILLLGLSCKSYAQNWRFASEIRDASEVIDVAIGRDNQVVIISRGLALQYHLCVYDSLGTRIKEKIWDFTSYYSNALFAVETDSVGNIYLVSRRTIEIEQGNFSKTTNTTPDLHTFIILEKYSANLELIIQVRLLKFLDGSEYGISIHDFIIDVKGNCWLAGETDSDAFELADAVRQPGKMGGHLLMLVGNNLQKVEWLNLFDGESAGFNNSTHIAVNNDGICLMSGVYGGTMRFGTTNLYNASSASDQLQETLFSTGEMYLVAVRESGDILWAQSMKAQSWDADVAALTGGDFVCGGSVYNSLRVGRFQIPNRGGGATFLMIIDPLSGYQKRITFELSSVRNIHAGANNDFVCDAQVNGVDNNERKICYCDSNLNITTLSQFTGVAGVSSMRNNSIYYSSIWNGVCSFGSEPKVLTVGTKSSTGAFLANFQLH